MNRSVQVELFDDHIRQDFPRRCNDRSASVVGGRFKGQDRELTRPTSKKLANMEFASKGHQVTCLFTE
jgi:hypothetical protein